MTKALVEPYLRGQVVDFLARIEKKNDPGVAKEQAALAAGLPQSDARDMGETERARVTRMPVRYLLESTDGLASPHQSPEAAVHNALMLDEASWVCVSDHDGNSVMYATIDAKK